MSTFVTVPEGGAGWEDTGVTPGTGEIVPLLVEDPELRRRAAQLLVDPELRMYVKQDKVRWQGMAPEVLAALEAALQDSDPGTRISAAIALLYREHGVEKALPVLGSPDRRLPAVSQESMARSHSPVTGSAT